MNSKWITDLNIKCKAIKFLENKTGENLGDLRYNNGFFRYNTKDGIHKINNQLVRFH